ARFRFEQLARHQVCHTRSGRESRADEFSRVFSRQRDASRTTAYVEVAVRDRFEAFPFQVHRLGTSLTAHHTDGFPVNNLGFRIDASPMRCLVDDSREQSLSLTSNAKRQKG